MPVVVPTMLREGRRRREQGEDEQGALHGASLRGLQ
jgi:hypothetical protein